MFTERGSRPIPILASVSSSRHIEDAFTVRTAPARASRAQPQTRALLPRCSFPEHLGRRALVWGCALLALAGAVRTVNASSMWRDDETLARIGIGLEPRSVNMRLLLIEVLDRAGRTEEAYHVAEESARLLP